MTVQRLISPSVALALSCSVLLVACSAPPASDAGVMPPPDDAGTSATDSGVPDAGNFVEGCVIDGGVVIDTLGDWQALVDGGCTTIVGDLRIRANEPELTPAATSLRVVGGAIELFNNASLSRLALPSLRSARVVNVASNLALSRIELPALGSSGLVINQNQGLQTVEVPSLTTAAQVSVRDNPALTGLELPALTSCGSLGFYRNTQATRLAAPLLITISGNLDVFQNGQLSELRLPALRTVTGNMNIYSNGLRQCQVDAIRAALTAAPGSYTSQLNTGMPNTCP